MFLFIAGIPCDPLIAIGHEGVGGMVFAVVVSPRDPNEYAEAAGIGALFGFSVIALGRWVFGPMWQSNGWLFRIILSIAGSGLLPATTLLVDLHAKFVVSRFYTGTAPIPYFMIDEFEFD